jgi:hypothetical protein
VAILFACYQPFAATTKYIMPITRYQREQEKKRLQREQIQQFDREMSYILIFFTMATIVCLGGGVHAVMNGNIYGAVGLPVAGFASFYCAAVLTLMWGQGRTASY